MIRAKAKHFTPGMPVIWMDPDDGHSSGQYTVIEVYPESCLIHSVHGSEAEVPYHELKIDASRLTEMIPAGSRSIMSLLVKLKIETRNAFRHKARGVVYQPVRAVETGELWSFQVFKDKHKAMAMFPGQLIEKYSGCGIQDPSFVD